MRNLTEKQNKFLDVLFEEAKGDPSQARKLSGYAETVSTTATKAAYSMKQVMDSPTDLGNKEKMVAAKDILDRGGFKATDKVEVTSSSPLFILPPKDE